MTDHIDSDKIAREKAINPFESFIVQAPAGSGKTELLIQRFLTLLGIVDKPEEILAITFTKKAANEMRTRIITALNQALLNAKPSSAHHLKTYQLAKAVLKRDAQFDWGLLSNPNQLRIQTIDALCAFLTKQLPLLSLFGSQPDIAQDAMPLYREAVQEILTHLEKNGEWSESISTLLSHLDNDLNKVESLLILLLAKRDQWLPYIHLDLNDSTIRAELERHIQHVITEALDDLHTQIPAHLLDEWVDIARYAASQLPPDSNNQELLHCLDLETSPTLDAHELGKWHGLARLVLTKSGQIRKVMSKDIGFPPLKNFKNPAEKALAKNYRERLEQLLSFLNEHESMVQRIIDLFYLPTTTYTDKQWIFLKSLLTVLKLTAAQLRLTFQQQGKIDYIENAQAALLALGSDDNPTNLALALDYQIKHLLVDEFQDTSFTQLQLLQKLIAGWEPGDGRTLFIVGDPMQSIYRFREAEVGLFLNIYQSGFSHCPLSPLLLSINFRSKPTIINWNNRHFKHIFPSYNDIVTGAVIFNESASLGEAISEAEDRSVQMIGLKDGSESDQATRIIQYIDDIEQKYPDDNIAILVRSRSHLTEIIPALKRTNKAFHAIDIELLTSQQTIQDLLALTTALLHLSDRIAWLAILRAPWCGLKLADLTLIAKDSVTSTIFDTLQKDELIKQLSPDAQARLARVTPIIFSQVNQKDRFSLREWVETTWMLLGGPACLNDLIEVENVKAYFDLLSQLSENTFINSDMIKQKVDALFASTQSPSANIQIMTIHSAKGLEFDTVIIPHLEKKMPSDDKHLLSWMEQPLKNKPPALLLAPIHATGENKDLLYEYIHRKQKQKADFETDRLLYVAATRAKKRLCLAFSISTNAKGELATEKGSFLHKLKPFLPEFANQIISCTDTESVPQTSSPRYLKRLVGDWQNPIKHQPVPYVREHHQAEGFKGIENTPQTIGTITHLLLQSISEKSIDWWQQLSQDQQSAIVQHCLRQFHIPLSTQPEAKQLILILINNTLSDVRGQWILKKRPIQASEYELTTFKMDQYQKHIIDKTFVDEIGTRWIIDYKTTAMNTADVIAFINREKEKYLDKMHEYARAMRSIEHRKIKIGLYFPAVPAWHEWEYQEEMKEVISYS